MNFKMIGRFLSQIIAIEAVFMLPAIAISLGCGETDALRGFLQEAKPAGLDAIETMYPMFDSEQTALARRLAEEFSLLQSGGSDFHGDTKPDISLGIGRGNLFVPAAFVTPLQEVTKNELESG